MTRRVRIPGTVAAFLVAASCAEEPAGPVDFDIEPATHAVLVGETVQMSAVGAPADVTWSSSNSIIAEVNASSGLVTGRSSGTVQITAVSGESYASANIQVNPDPAQTHPFGPIAAFFATDYPGQLNGLACTNCHGVLAGAGAYDWVRARVSPGNPDAGVLMCKVTGGNGCGTAMPLPAPQIAAIRNWIAAGANR